MNFYSYIKMINYIRLHKPDPEILTETVVPLWEDEEYMSPGKMETWLMYGELKLIITIGYLAKVQNLVPKCK